MAVKPKDGPRPARNGAPGAPESADRRFQESSLSHREIETAISTALKEDVPAAPSGTGLAWYPYCREVYDDYVVYEGEKGALFSRSYVLDSVTQEVTLGDPKEVVERKEYFPVKEATSDVDPDAPDILRRARIGATLAVAAGDGWVVGELEAHSEDAASIRTADGLVEVGYADALAVNASEAKGDDHFYGAWKGGSGGGKGKGGGAGGGKGVSGGKSEAEMTRGELAAEIDALGPMPSNPVAKAEWKADRDRLKAQMDKLPVSGGGLNRLEAGALARNGGRPQRLGRNGRINEALTDAIAAIDEDTVAISEAADADLEEAGKRNSLADSRRLQAAHDALVEAGATCSQAGMAEAGGPEPIIEADASAPSVDMEFRESGFAEVEGHAALVTLQEAGAVFNDVTREVTITPIRPGFGNARDGYYYPAGPLRAAVEAGVFNNRKMYRDHPTKTEEKEQPERSTTKWFATAKETTWDEVKQVPRTRIKVYDKEAYERFKEAPDEIAFSIRGRGKSREGKVDGQRAKIVESLPIVRSIDWVTEAGAGGAIESFSESAREEIEMEFKDLTLEQLRDARPDLFKSIREAADDDAKPEGDAKPDAKADADAAAGAAPDSGNADANAKPDAAAAPEADAKPDAGGAAPASPTGPESFLGLTSIEQLVDALAPALVDRIQGVASDRQKVQESAQEKRAKAKKVVTAEIQASGLTRRAKEVVLESFAEAAIDPDDEKAWKDEGALKAAIGIEVGKAARIMGIAPRAGVTGLGAAPAADPARAVTSRVEESLGGRWGSDEPPKTERGSRQPAGDGGVIEVPGSSDDKESERKGVVDAHTSESDGKAAVLSEAGASVFDSLSDRLGVERAPTAAK